MYCRATRSKLLSRLDELMALLVKQRAADHSHATKLAGAALALANNRNGVSVMERADDRPSLPPKKGSDDSERRALLYGIARQGSAALTVCLEV